MQEEDGMVAVYGEKEKGQTMSASGRLWKTCHTKMASNSDNGTIPDGIPGLQGVLLHLWLGLIAWRGDPGGEESNS